MIQSEWFDADYTTTVFDDIVETYSLRDIVDARLTDPTFNPMRGYAMGGLNADYTKFISGKHISAQTDQNNDCYITDTIKSTVAPSQSFWGFGVWNPNYLDVPCWFDESAGRWGDTSTLNQPPLFVQEMRAYALRYVTAGVRVQFKICNPQSVDIQISGGGSYSCYVTAINGYENLGQSMYLSFSDLREFVENGQSITVTDNDHGSFSLRYSDLIDGRYWQQGNYFIFCELIGSTSITARYDQYTNDSRIQPIVSTKCGDNIILLNPFAFLFGNTQLAVSDKFGDDQLRIVYWTQNTYDSYHAGYYQDVYAPLGNYFLGADEFELPVGFFDYMNRLANFQYVIDTNNNGLVWYYTGPNSYITVGGRTCWRYKTRPVIDFDILYFVFGLLNRVQDPDDSTAPTARYVTDDFISIYTNNIPNPEFIVYTGNYDPIVPRLMDWQQYGHDISEDDYKPEEPQPEPGGDTPGDEPQNLPHDDGDPPELQKDRVIGVPSNFITQYALTSAELTTIGSNLWQTWLTPNTDVWKNFFLPYAQDFGTLNIGAALDFIVSLKVFPFEFTVDYYTPANGVRMGTGHTDFLGSSAPVVKSQIICVSAGSVKIELPNPYNDFRDMYNCSALCFMPYCGTVELNLQEILGRTLKASYFIDCQSGGCTCVIECEGDAGDYVISSKTGQIGFTIPMTATNAGQLAAQAMSDATKAIGTLSGFFFDSGKTIGNNLTSAISAQLGKKTGISEKGEVSLLSGNTFETSTKLGQSAVNTGLSLANQAIDMLSRSAVEMPMLSGGGSAESFMFADCVSIQIRRGRYKKPDNYPHSVGHYNLSSHPISYFKGVFTGSPSTGSNTGKGFCTFVGIDTSGLDCRDDERAEIISLLESGVYL